MAKTTISRVGYGQVEPNHLSAQRTGQIYAQLPADDAITLLENGQYVKYDYENGKVDFSGDGEWMMVFNEVKLYDDWRESYKDFAMEKDNYTPGTYSYVDASNQTQTATVDHGVSTKGQMVPRVIKTNVGDIYTTNCLGVAGAKNATTNGIEVEVGTELTPSNTGYLNVTNDADNESMVWKVVKVYTMPDNQPGVKLQRTK